MARRRKTLGTNPLGAGGIFNPRETAVEEDNRMEAYVRSMQVVHPDVYETEEKKRRKRNPSYSKGYYSPEDM